MVVPVSKEAGRSEYESRIEFKSSDGKIACSLDYSSEDNEHGFRVVKAEWTPDSQYFVFSLTSSGSSGFSCAGEPRKTAEKWCSIFMALV